MMVCFFIMVKNGFCRLQTMGTFNDHPTHTTQQIWMILEDLLSFHL